MGLEVSIDNKKDFELVTKKIQPGIIADVVDKGLVPNKYKPGTTQHKCYFVWILEELDSEGRNKRAFQSFTLSLDEKANLRKQLDEWKIPMPAKGEKFNPTSLIGTSKVLVLSIEDSKEKGGKPFVKIVATMDLEKGQTPVEIPADFKRKEA